MLFCTSEAVRFTFKMTFAEARDLTSLAIRLVLKRKKGFCAHNDTAGDFGVYLRYE